MITAARLKASDEPRRSRPQDVDRHVGIRMRERRIMLGLTQQQMAELIGVTYQQAHKYEKGINRIAGGRLYQIAQALGVDVGYFYEGLGGDGANFKPSQQQRLLLELARGFIALPAASIRKPYATWFAPFPTLAWPSPTTSLTSARRPPETCSRRAGPLSSGRRLGFRPVGLGR